MERVIGKCSICGGLVTVPDAWYSIIPPVPTCKSCGATKQSDLPIIKMTPVYHDQIPVFDQTKFPGYGSLWKVTC